MKKYAMQEFIIYPFIFSAFNILFLYQVNIDQVNWVTIVLPLCIAQFATFAILNLIQLLINNWKRSAFLTFCALCLFFSYGRLFHLRVHEFSHDKIAFFGCLFLFLTIAITVKQEKCLVRLNRFLSIACFVLLAVTLLQIAHFAIRNVVSGNRYAFISSKPKIAPSQHPFATVSPDIYYIILDGYGSEKTLTELYNFDNSDFINYLRSSGFYIASESRSNYAMTAVSLASSLNMDYLDKFLNESARNSNDKTYTYHLIQNNDLFKHLRSMGYMIIDFSSGWGATHGNKNADLDITTGTQDEFIRTLFKSTLLAPFTTKWMKANARGGILNIFQGLEKIALMPESTFVFAHVVSPHPPYLFASDGGAIENMGLEMSGDSWQERKLYLGQLQFINSKVKVLVKKILEDSSQDPIIILQSDHGTETLRPFQTPYEKLEKKHFDERMSNFTAIYAPKAAQGLYQTITPVNIFRIIFNYYFDSKFALLKDASYFSNFETPFKFIDVDEFNRQHDKRELRS